MKPSGWVVDMRHYLDEEIGDLPETIPERALNLAVFFGAIVAWVTNHLPEDAWLTNVPCRRRPGRRPCRGEIIAERPTPGFCSRLWPSSDRAVGRGSERGRRTVLSVTCFDQWGGQVSGPNGGVPDAALLRLQYFAAPKLLNSMDQRVGLEGRSRNLLNFWV